MPVGSGVAVSVGKAVGLGVGVVVWVGAEVNEGVGVGPLRMVMALGQ